MNFYRGSTRELFVQYEILDHAHEPVDHIPELFKAVFICKRIVTDELALFAGVFRYSDEKSYIPIAMLKNAYKVDDLMRIATLDSDTQQLIYSVYPELRNFVWNELHADLKVVDSRYRERICRAVVRYIISRSTSETQLT